MAVQDLLPSSGVQTVDGYRRPLRDLRISVTDRCNFRCTYCMPKEVFGPGFAFLPRAELLRFEEIARLARLFVELGVRKFRLTGGEPLLRRDIEKLVELLASIPGAEDIALTTNGALLTPEKARALKAAGLRRITVSLDSLDDAVFTAMNDVGFPVQRVLAAIDAAADAGLRPVKVDMVVKRGVNVESVLPMAEHFRGTGHILRFIEFMDVGNSNGWRMEDVVSASDLMQMIDRQWPLEALDANYYGEVASRYRYQDGAGEVGSIASVTVPFCSTCTRARLSADGQLFTCLFAEHGHDLRGLLRSGETDTAIGARLRSIWAGRTDQYSALRTSQTQAVPKVEMSYIGG